MGQSWRTWHHGAEIVVDKAVERLAPFQYDIGPVLGVEGDETAVQCPALLFEHPYGDIDARLAQTNRMALDVL